MRYDLTDFEWSVVEPLLPMDRRGPKPKNNRQILNGMFYILRTGCPWRDLPERYGPYTTVYNRFNRWRKAGIWDRMMGAIVKAHDGNVQMIDSSIVRVHQHASGVKKRVEFVVSVEAGAGLRRKHVPAQAGIHARVDGKGRPVRLLISPGNDHDVVAAKALLEGIEPGAVVIADKGYDADSVRACIRDHGAVPNIPNRANRKRKHRWKKAIYRQRNLVERFFNKLKQFRHIATRYDKLGATFFAFIQLASIRIFLRSIESTA
jgi:transposase